MKKRITRILFAMPVLVILSGCGGAVRYPNYYTLHVPPPPDPPMAQGVHASLAVREFREPSYLRARVPLFTRNLLSRSVFTIIIGGQ